MKRTSRISIFVLLLTILTHQLAQGQGYEPPRIVNGKPDLQGTWSNASITTLERNVRYTGSTLSDDEVIRATDDHPQNVRLATDDNMVAGQLPDGTDLGRGRGYNAFWIDPDSTAERFKVPIYERGNGSPKGSTHSGPSTSRLEFFYHFAPDAVQSPVLMPW